MLSLLFWYLTLLLLHLLTFPLAFRLFPHLRDRGYTFARVLGLLVWGFLFWLSVTLRLASNDYGGLLLALLLLAGLSLWSARTRWSEIKDWLTDHASLITLAEILFLLAFLFLAIIRAANSEITGTEKPMELAFINAILRSPDFPPRDPWLSGYAISYYHFGYILTAMLARFTGTPGSVAFNLMISAIFALSALGAYGLVYNLLGRESGRGSGEDGAPLGLPLLGPLFLLLVSNLGGLLEVLHRLGLFWPRDPGARFNVWQWLNIRELNEAPTQPFGLLPDRFWWWWRSSRVVSDYSLNGNFAEVIDEFPFFSYLLADLHPHVLAMPFLLLAVAFALNVYLDDRPERREVLGLPLAPLDLLTGGVLLGGLAFLNTWDILPALTLVLGASLLARLRQQGWSGERIEETLALALALIGLSVLLYLPFFAGFGSQAGGILPNLVNPTRGAHLWVMFATLFVPLFAYLLFLTFRERWPLDWRGPALALGGTLLLWALSWLLALIVARLRPETATGFLQAQGVADVSALFAAATRRRLAYLGGTATLVVLLGLTLGLLFRRRPAFPSVVPPFVLLLIAIGALLVLGVDFFYLADQFGSRMNTVFKFYYQAWELWSVAAAFGAALLLRRLRGALWPIVLTIVLVAGLIYPALAIPNKTNNFKPYFGWTMDGAAYLARFDPDEAAAIRFLQSAPYGVVLEATGGQYSQYARIATHTGLPTVLGWLGHEFQWRGNRFDFGSRPQDIPLLYETPDWETARLLLERYHVRYVYVGPLERTTYAMREEKFAAHLPVIFRSGGVTVYQVP